MLAKVSLLAMLSARDVNANTPLQYFKWADAGLDDAERVVGEKI